MTENEPFRSYLQAELVRRCGANPGYSLRAFARTLAAEPSYLSKLLNGKRAFTPKAIARFGARLNLTAQELGSFEAAAAGRKPARSRRANASFVALDPDRFRLIAEWHHYAILELLRLPGFRLTPRAVSRMLGISIIEAKDGITRLDRLGMIPKASKGQAAPPPANHTTLGTADTAAAFRRLQRQILESALKALEEIPVEERDQSSLTIAVDRRKLPEVRRRIRDFRRSLDAFLQASGRPDSVYQLSISLYPVTRSSTKAVLKTKGRLS